MKTPRLVALSCLSLSTLFAVRPAAAAEAYPKGVDVYTSQTDGYRAFRIPAIEIAPDGSLLCVAEGRRYTVEDPGFGKQEVDLVCKRSTDGGATWSAMQVVEHAGPLWAAANPSTVVDKSNGKVWVFYVRAKPYCSSDTARPGTDDAQNMARWSSDNGKTWSEAIDMTGVARDMKDMKWRMSIPGPGGAIQTRTGRLVVAMWKMPFSDFTVYSDDHGKTWQRGQIVPGPQGGDEPKVVELGDGTILFDMRQEVGPTKWLAESTDGGASWHNLRRGVAVGPVATGIKRLAEGSHAWLLWTGPKDGKRKDLVIRTSPDEGKTFPAVKQAITDQHSAYSDVIVLPDGSAGVIWERGIKHNYEFITFTRLSRPWLAPVLPGRSG